MGKNTQLKSLYDENIDSLYRFAYFKMQTHEHEVLDVIQDSFIKLAQKLEDWEKIDNLKAYIYRILNNKIIDFHRKNKPISLDEQIEEFWDTFSQESQIENIADAKLQVEKIYHILSGLNNEDKNIFLLRFVEEFSPKQIAEKLSKDVNTITVKLHRLKSKVITKFNQTNW